MSFFLLLVYLVLSFLRLGEMYPELAPLQIMSLATLACAAATVVAAALGHRPPLTLPQPYLVLAFLAWCMASVIAAQRWVGGYAGPLGVLAPGVTVFLLLYFNVDSTKRLRLTCLALSALSLVLSAQVLYSYHTHWRAKTFLLRTREDQLDDDVPADAESEWSEDESQQPDQPRVSGDTSDDEPDPLLPPTIRWVIRVRSLGFLNDPNDLAQALVSMLPFVFVARRPKRRWRNLVLVWLPTAAILYTVALTRSRGAILALGALCFLALQPLLGRTLSLAIGVAGGLAAMALGFTGGRSMSVDESAEGRLEAWAAGLEMLKGSPIWGVGQGMFTDHHPLVAHNSFIHCFAETGLVGYFLWLAMIVVTFLGLLRAERAGDAGPEAEALQPFARAVRMGLATFLVAAFFLSRTYGVMLFLHLGLGAVVCVLAKRSRPAEAPLPPARLWAPATALLAVTSVFGFWVLMKVLPH